MVVGCCRIDVWYVVAVRSMVKVRDGKRKKARGLNYDLIEALELLRLRRSGYCSALGTLAQLITHEHKLEAIMELKDVQLPHVILEVARA